MPKTPTDAALIYGTALCNITGQHSAVELARAILQSHPEDVAAIPGEIHNTLVALASEPGGKDEFVENLRHQVAMHVINGAVAFWLKNEATDKSITEWTVEITDALVARLLRD